MYLVDTLQEKVVKHAIDEDARRRLLDAQRAEALALKAWAAAKRRREQLQVAVASSDAAVEGTLRALVKTSGADRASLLSGVPIVDLRRIVRRADGT